MTLKDFCDDFYESWQLEGGDYFRGLLSVLTPLSRFNLYSYQVTFVEVGRQKEGVEVYRKEQEKMLRHFIRLEMAETGEKARKQLGMEKLEWTTILPRMKLEKKSK